MADLSITAANVTWVSGNPPIVTLAGETITAGQPIYDDGTGTWYKADANGVAAKQVATGLAIGGASAGGYFTRVGPGTVVAIGATVVVGNLYFLSDTVGGIADAIPSIGNVVLIGSATTTAQMKVLLTNTGVATLA